ncbi:MAG: DUF1156 domain-containing protein [Proteobacteria bacterium]|nr:DUF1156 domain-containing protein [Pseudomonadota bacterium]
MTDRKKLIEVALPLPEINDASAYDKMPGIGPHPKGIHHWWARLPLPTARAVLFASVVDDPSEHPEKWPTEAAQNVERERLFGIIRRMMGKKLHDHPEVYAEARDEMLKHCDGKLPAVFDPFAGGGSIPLEANRLGFEAHAGDLNPVAALLNKCNLELAPRWAGHPPVNPEDRKRIGGTQSWRGTHGLAADVRHYGRLIRDRAQASIGHLYPKARLPKEHGGGEANVIAWIWARTAASPDPAARGKHVPLISTYWLSNKKGGEAWLEPVVDKATGTWRFEVRRGSPNDRAAIGAGTKRGRGSNFQCLLTGTPISEDHVRNEGQRGRFGLVLLAVVASAGRGRIYLPANADHTTVAQVDAPVIESGDMPDNARWFSPPLVGLKTYTSVFAPRQLTAMVALSDLVKAIRVDLRRDAAAAGLPDRDADTYASTVTTFLALAVDRSSDFNNGLCRWSPSNQKVMNLFGRQAIPMVWDFAEANILGESVGAWSTCSEYVADCIEVITVDSGKIGQGRQIDAAGGADGLRNLLVSTDPPYYDNIGYAALSDFFYVWLRRTIGEFYPNLLSTLLVPKLPELTASPERFEGNKERAKEHFETGFRKAFTALRDKMDPRFPLTVYYAFKQDDEKTGSDDECEGEGIGGVDLTTGWETLLDALIASGFQITGTWPVRASQKWRMVSMGTNALASYIVLACRPRAANAPQTDRRSFVAELKRELPSALRHLQQGNIAPVDFAQAAIGPGMAIYSRYGRILESSGNAMTVRTALSLINQTLTEVLSEQEDEYDADTRWAIAWFEQQGFSEGDFGMAELLSKAKVTSVTGLQQAGFIHSKGGKVRLLRPEELPIGWDPTTDKRLTIWEMTHHLLRIYFHEKAGDEATAALLRKLGSRGEIARDLAYRLFDVCEKKKRSQEALAYNALVLGWPELARLAREGARGQQATLFEGE